MFSPISPSKAPRSQPRYVRSATCSVQSASALLHFRQVLKWKLCIRFSGKYDHVLKTAVCSLTRSIMKRRCINFNGCACRNKNASICRIVCKFRCDVLLTSNENYQICHGNIHLRIAMILHCIQLFLLCPLQYPHLNGHPPMPCFEALRQSAGSPIPPRSEDRSHLSNRRMLHGFNSSPKSNPSNTFPYFRKKCLLHFESSTFFLLCFEILSVYRLLNAFFAGFLVYSIAFFDLLLCQYLTWKYSITFFKFPEKERLLQNPLSRATLLMVFPVFSKSRYAYAMRISCKYVLKLTFAHFRNNRERYASE